MLTKQDLASIKALFRDDFKGISDKFKGIDLEFEHIDKRFDKLDKKIDSIRTELITYMNENTDELVKLYTSDNGMMDLTDRVEKLEQRHYA